MITRSVLTRGTAAALVALIVAGAAVLVHQVNFGTTIAAYFTKTIAIYPGDEVRVLGVKVGTVKSIAPEGTQAKLTMDIDQGISIPASAQAIIVAQNLVAARYVQLTPAYEDSGPTMADGATIPVDRTAIPVEWDQVKEQLSRLATDLGPKSGVSSSSVGQFIDSAANALGGNGDKLRQTLSQLSGLGRILADGSGNIVDVITNLQTLVTALRDSGEQIVEFENRFATLTGVLDGSKSDLDAALTNLSSAVGDVQRFIAGTRDKTAEQIQRLANVTQNLVDNKMALQNVLHAAPNAFSNGYNIYNPDTGSFLGSFSVNNLSNPTNFICSALGAIQNATASETAKLCAQYLGPALRLFNFNNIPIPLNPYLMKSASPENIIYSEPGLAPGGAGPKAGPADIPPAISAYTGLADNPFPAPAQAAPPFPPGPSAPDHLPAAPSPALYPGAPIPPGVADQSPTGGTTLPDLLLPAEAPLPNAVPQASVPQPTQGTPPS
ncbi:MCE family protein [Mycolicibacterium sp.]|uniref:MCE family protein n=1 Tax=Mycolicibacterium sp. TaxID=2320850 RepID=UPI001A3442D2|nr:MCE family protein [Mycolicibacterium sp.]MBJ7337176.1 MCE family protein [Mycolicibacterium sp.]